MKKKTCRGNSTVKLISKILWLKWELCWRIKIKNINVNWYPISKRPSRWWILSLSLLKSLTCLRKKSSSAMRIKVNQLWCEYCYKQKVVLVFVSVFIFQLQSHLVEMGIAMTDKNETIRTQQEVKRSRPE